jgi:hypothetical protein
MSRVPLVGISEGELQGLETPGGLILPVARFGFIDRVVERYLADFGFGSWWPNCLRSGFDDAAVNPRERGPFEPLLSPGPASRRHRLRDGL